MLLAPPLRKRFLASSTRSTTVEEYVTSDLGALNHEGVATRIVKPPPGAVQLAGNLCAGQSHLARSVEACVQPCVSSNIRSVGSQRDPVWIAESPLGAVQFADYARAQQPYQALCTEAV